MPGSLVLEVTRFTDHTDWRWELRDGKGNFLADHEADLRGGGAKLDGWNDLQGYLKHHAAPDRWEEDQRKLLAAFGDWLTEKAFGEIAEVLDDHRPTTLRVLLPEGAEELALHPLEAARIDGEPLILAGVTPVFVFASDEAAAEAAPIDGPLRMLALFSVPPKESPLDLRRERHALRNLVRTLRGTGRRADIELRTLQYGTTRDELKRTLRSGDGWDVIHFSGHGMPGAVVLEGEGGASDPISANDLAKLLRPHRARLKLVTLSACWSGAAVLNDELRRLGVAEEALPSRDAGNGAVKTGEPVARILARTLDCAVLAMRFPVGDGFAIQLASGLYYELFKNEADLATALTTAVSDAMETGGHSPLSAATVSLLGDRAAGLTLCPPGGAENPDRGPFAGVPVESDRFVGRVAPLSQALAAMNTGSGAAGVLFHGMAGAGKTALAIELTHHMIAGTRFRGAVWWRAPDSGEDFTGALMRFGAALEPLWSSEYTLASAAASERTWADCLPRLIVFLRDNAVLLVLDNLESLLESHGGWRDRRFAALLAALAEAARGNGLSRVVLTSRVRPADLPAGVVVEPVHALPVAEAWLLMAESPKLGQLMRDGGEGWSLARRLLRLVQGHPKLIELAEAKADDRAALTAMLDAAATAWNEDGAALDAYFQAGGGAAEEADFARALSGWVEQTLSRLDPTARTLFQTLCAIEEGDREDWVLAAVWPRIWGDLNGASHEPSPTKVGEGGDPLDPSSGAPGGGGTLRGGDAGIPTSNPHPDASRHPSPTSVGEGVSEEPPEPPDAPDLAPLLSALYAAALVEPEEEGSEEARVTRLTIHPGVAEAGLSAAPERLRAVVDKHLAGFWTAVYQMGLQRESQGGGPLIRRAGLAAFPYLMRRRDWETASSLLERGLLLDASPNAFSVVLPRLRLIAEATGGTERELIDRGKLAKALWTAGQGGVAKREMRAVVATAVERRQFRIASAVSGDLINLLRARGALAEALTVAEEMAEYTRRAGLGPWSQLADEARRLQILGMMGRHEEVLEAVKGLREPMAGLPETGEMAESVLPWNVREATLDVGHTSALATKRWQAALDFNAEILEVTKARGANSLELARTRFNDYGPLLSLDRFEEAAALLTECRTAFEAAGHLEYLGKALGAQAELASVRSQYAEARRLEGTALRTAYRIGDPVDVAISHNNLANHICRDSGEWDDVLAYRLAAIILGSLMGSGYTADWFRNLVINLHQIGDDATAAAALPADFDTLVERVERVEGVRFRDMVSRLAPPDTDLDDLLRRIIARTFATLEQARKEEGGEGDGGAGGEADGGDGE